MKKIILPILLIVLMGTYCLAAEDDEVAIEDEITIEEMEALSEDSNEEGLALAKEGKTEEAIELFKEAIEIDELNLNAYLNLGYVYAWNGRNDEAVATFLELIDIVPESIAAYRNLISIYGLQGNNAKVIEYGEKALETNPEDYTIMANLVGPYINTMEYDKAIGFLDRLIERNPNRPRLYRLISKAYYGKGDTKKSREAFEKSYNMIKETTLYDKAPEKTKTVDELFNEMRGDALFEKGGRFLGAGENDKAVKAFEESIVLTPKDYRPYLVLAKIYAYRAKTEISLSYLTEALTLNPTLASDIKDSEDFKPLQDIKEFQDLIANY
ncbi:MAG: tetratricopeptide repeat protein [Candidatus Omnitrophota bacterium]